MTTLSCSRAPALGGALGVRSRKLTVAAAAQSPRHPERPVDAGDLRAKSKHVIAVFDVHASQCVWGGRILDRTRNERDGAKKAEVAKDLTGARIKVSVSTVGVCEDSARFGDVTRQHLLGISQLRQQLLIAKCAHREVPDCVRPKGDESLLRKLFNLCPAHCATRNRLFRRQQLLDRSQEVA